MWIDDVLKQEEKELNKFPKICKYCNKEIESFDFWIKEWNCCERCYDFIQKHKGNWRL